MKYEKLAQGFFFSAEERAVGTWLLLTAGASLLHSLFSDSIATIQNGVIMDTSTAVVLGRRSTETAAEEKVRSGSTGYWHGVAKSKTRTHGSGIF